MTTSTNAASVAAEAIALLRLFQNNEYPRRPGADEPEDRELWDRVETTCAALASPGAVAAPADHKQVSAAICQRVSELPDRNSPEDWPEAMLVTADELSMIVADELHNAGAVAAEPTGWMLIERATTEGDDVEILCFKPGVGRIIVTWLDAEHPDADGVAGWHESWSHKRIEGITLYMPLPPAPKE